MMTTRLVPILAMIALCLAATVAVAIEPGDPAPPLGLETTLEGPPPEELTWERLQGQAVVVDLWATWCAPCIDALPHWNELVAEFDGEPIRFLSISDESETSVRKFLERWEAGIAGWLALDRDDSFIDAFGPHVYPRVILVDAQGTVRGITHPESLTAEALRRLLQGEDPEVPASIEVEQRALPNDRDGAMALYQVAIWPVEGGEKVEHRMSLNSGEVVGHAMAIRPLLPLAYGLPRSRIVVETELPEGFFDVVVRTGGQQGAVAPALRQALETSFGWVSETEMRETDVYLLQHLPGREPPTPEPGAGRRQVSGHGMISAERITADELAPTLARVAGRPVIDETGLAGEYRVELRWDQDDSASLLEEVRKELGLQLVPARRSVEVVVIRPRER